MNKKLLTAHRKHSHLREEFPKIKQRLNTKGDYYGNLNVKYVVDNKGFWD